MTRLLVPGLLAWAIAGAAPAYAQGADTSGAGSEAHLAPAAGQAPGDTLTLHVGGRMSGAGSYQRLMAEADSLLKLRGGSHAENAQLYLSWDAPWGSRRARAVRMPACGDSTRADTLYLSFYPGRSTEHFNGFTGQLRFLATGNDTLGPWWHMESKGGENGGNVLVEFGPSPDIPGPQPWPTGGRGFALIDRTPTAMRLRVLFAMTLDDAGPLDANVTYTLCRVILRHRPARRLAGCEQPVCVQWESGTLGFGLKDEPEVRRGERFVSYGAPQAVCEPFREPRVQTWKPKAPLK